MTRAAQAFARQQLDRRLSALRSTRVEAFATPPASWVRAIRDALGMTASELGARMGLTRARIYALEAGEVDGATSLTTLRRAAAAMNCTLVYALVPNESLDAMVKRQADELARRHVGQADRTMRLEDQATSAAAREAAARELAADYARKPPRKFWSLR